MEKRENIIENIKEDIQDDIKENIKENIKEDIKENIKEDLKDNKIGKAVTVLFLCIELIIFVIYMFLDSSKQGSIPTSNNLKFIGIILCFLFSFFMHSKDADQKDIYILRSALLFTLIADLFILILDHYTLGTITFCIVQLLYLIRLYRWGKHLGIKSSILKCMLRNLFIAMGVLYLLIAFKIEIDWLLISSVFYFVSIVLNVWDSIWIAKKTKAFKMVIFAFGMILFLLCDINVGLFNVSDFVVIDSIQFSRIYAFATIAMWMFYLPAQVAIALSGEKVIWKRGRIH